MCHKIGTDKRNQSDDVMKMSIALICRVFQSAICLLLVFVLLSLVSASESKQYEGNRLVEQVSTIKWNILFNLVAGAAAVVLFHFYHRRWRLSGVFFSHNEEKLNSMAAIQSRIYAKPHTGINIKNYSLLNRNCCVWSSHIYYMVFSCLDQVILVQITNLKKQTKKKKNCRKFQTLKDTAKESIEANVAWKKQQGDRIIKVIASR